MILPETHLQLLPVGEAIASVVSDLGADFELIPYGGPGSLEPYLDRVDAVYLAEGSGIPDSEIREMAATFRERRLPSFSGGRGQDVEMGFMATHQAEENLNRFFRRIALHVEAIMNGRNLSEQPILVDFTQRLTLNFNTTVIVRVPLKTSLIADTDLIGDFTNPLAEQTYSLRDMVHTVYPHASSEADSTRRTETSSSTRSTLSSPRRSGGMVGRRAFPSIWIAR